MLSTEKQLTRNSVLRLYPSVPVNVRTALQDTTLPYGGGPDGSSPILIKKGEDVGYSVYVMHRSETIYGPDALEFRPSRWLPGSNTQTDTGDAGWGYLPFNGGPRICLGRKFSIYKIGEDLLTLVQGSLHCLKRRTLLFVYFRSSVTSSSML